MVGVLLMHYANQIGQTAIEATLKEGLKGRPSGPKMGFTDAAPALDENFVDVKD
jgi:hypothetical protein